MGDCHIFMNIYTYTHTHLGDFWEAAKYLCKYKHTHTHILMDV